MNLLCPSTQSVFVFFLHNINNSNSLLIYVNYVFSNNNFDTSELFDICFCDMLLIKPIDVFCLYSLVGQVVGCLIEVFLVFALLLRLSVLGEYWIGITCGRYSDAQVSKAGDQYSGRCTVINDVPSSLGCVLFILF